MAALLSKLRFDFAIFLLFFMLRLWSFYTEIVANLCVRDFLEGKIVVFFGSRKIVVTNKFLYKSYIRALKILSVSSFDVLIMHV